MKSLSFCVFILSMSFTSAAFSDDSKGDGCAIAKQALIQNDDETTFKKLSPQDVRSLFERHVTEAGVLITPDLTEDESKVLSSSLLSAFIDATPDKPHFDEKIAREEFNSNEELRCAFVRSLKSILVEDKNEKVCPDQKDWQINSRSSSGLGLRLKQVMTLDSLGLPIFLDSLKGKRVLSLGEGFSGTVPFFHLFDVNAFALDISSAYSRNNHPYLWAFPEYFVQADATHYSHLDFAKEKFDHIISLQMLCCLGLEKAVQAVLDSLNALKADGTLRFVWGAEDGGHALFHEDSAALLEDASKKKASVVLKDRAHEFLGRIIAGAEKSGIRIKIAFGRLGFGGFAMVIQRDDNSKKGIELGHKP